jgi:hypothetical protein
MGFDKESSVTKFLFPIFFAISGFCECTCWPGKTIINEMIKKKKKIYFIKKNKINK